MFKQWKWALVGLTLAGMSLGADWPQWQGIDRTAISKETGLLKEWPKDGPPLAWKVKDLGGGYVSPSVADGRIFGMSYRGGDEVVWALEEKTGKEIWKTKIAEKGKAGYNEGPRCTPTVDGDVIYCIGISGDLVCLEVATGMIRWQKSFTKDFGGKVPNWGYTESPLVDGDKLLATPGGKEASIVCLDKKNGNVNWKAVVKGNDGAGYSSIIAAEVQGVRQYIQFMSRGVVGVAAEDGKFLWRFDAPANGTANITTPVYFEDHVFATSAYNKGGGLAKLTKQATGAFEAKEVYFSVKDMKNHHGGVVLIDGFLYGNNGGSLACMDFKTGKTSWEDRKCGKGSIAAADSMLYYRSEEGLITLAEVNSKSFVQKGQFKQPDQSGKKTWPHPVIANGKMYILDQSTLLCYDIKGN